MALVSNTAYLEVLDAVPLEGSGWFARVLSERDWTSMIAEVHHVTELGVTLELNAEGGGRVALDADDPLLHGTLPLGESRPIIEQEALWQIIHDGMVRGEFLAEDVAEDVVLTSDGPRSTVVSGRGTGVVLEWAKVLPAGMPTPTTLSREFVSHPMGAWLTLLREAQANGVLPFVRPLFSGVEDSAGQPWGASQAITVNAGDDLLTLLKRWCEQRELMWRMLPGFRLQVFQQFGHHRESEIVFPQWRGQSEHKRTVTRRDIANQVFASSGDSGVAVAESTTSQARWRKRMAWVTAGDSSDASARSMVANASLQSMSDQSGSRSIKVPSDLAGRVPLQDFTLGDWVTMEIPGGAEPGAMRVLGVTIDVGDDGQATHELTLQSRRELRELRIQRAIDGLGGSATSGSGGASASPIPVTRAMAAGKLTDLTDVDLLGVQAGDVLQWNGSTWVDKTPTLGLLADVDLQTPPSNGQALTFSSASGRWEPKTITGGGGGASSLSRYEPLPAVYGSGVSGNSDQTKGVIVYCTTDCTVMLLGARLNTVSGKKYRFRIFELAASGTTIIGQVGESYDVSSPGTLSNQTVTVEANINIDRGKIYILAATDISGAPIQLVWESANKVFSSQHLTSILDKQFARVNATNPTSANGWTTGPGPYSMIAETVGR